MDARRRNTWLVLGAGLMVTGGLGLLVLCGLAIGGFLLGMGKSLSGLASSAPAVGSSAPDFELATLSGGTIRLSDRRGHPVVINFWATWCGPCVLEMPVLQSRYERYAPELKLLAVNASESKRQVQAFVSSHALTFDVLLDPLSDVQRLYSVYAFPTTYFVDAEGVIQAQFIGDLSESEMNRLLKTIGIGK